MGNSDDQEEAIFEAANELTDLARRRAFLDEACAHDRSMRQRIEDLLSAQADAERFFVEGASALEMQAGVSVVATERLGDRIGRYKLLQKIGEGGCGMVYLAEQEEPVRRRVALKVIKLGMDTQSVIARFEAERQALAMMDHPNIAKVLDAGATENGRPFFVMELVHGVKITDFCEGQGLSIRARLGLFIEVCQAIQHAHQKGIIHRDIKPSNVLVMRRESGEAGIPKVIDFGIAKATTDQRLTDKTVFTVLEQFIGTPAYMSPEQAIMSSQDVDTRSDIYSLGVLLYELLTGNTPFDTEQLLRAGLVEMRRTICEIEPVRPSARLTMALATSTATRTDSRSKTQNPKASIDRDLDWIVMKSLEKDRTRRYATANALAMDVQRHLQSEPVLARPPSWNYAARKTVRRHKWGFAAAALIALILVLGVVVSSWEAARARYAEHEQARLANDAQDKARRLQANVVRQYVANGTRLMNQRDLFGALLWYTEALRLDSGDPRREESHRIRIASLLRQCPRLLNVFSHGAMLFHAEFSLDGQRLVTASDDHTARVWDLASGRQQLILQHDGEVYDARFSPDGRRIVTCSQDRTAGVWDAATGARLRSIEHPTIVWRACFSPDARLLLTAGEDGTARLWNLESAEATPKTFLAGDRVEQVGFSPDGHLFSTVSQNQIARLWDVATGERRFQVSHNGNYADVPFSPDSQHFLTADGRNLRLWDAKTFKEAAFSPLQHADGINGIGFGPDGSMLVSCGEDCTARVWNALSGQPLLSGVRHATGINLVRVSPDGRRFLTAGENGIAQIWDVHTGQLVTSPLKHILYVKYAGYNADGHRILVNSCDQAARVWDTTTGELLGPAPPALTSERRLSSRDGQRLLLLGQSNIVWILDTQSGHRQPLPHADPVTYASFSRDDRTVITACQRDLIVSSMRNEIFLWDAASGVRLNTNSMSQSFQLMYVAFSPDNRRLLACGFDYLARLWDARDGQQPSDLMRHAGRVYWGAFSPDGRSVVTASWDKTARVWDAATGQPLTAPLQHSSRVIGAYWSIDARRLRTVTLDHHLQVWDLSQSEPLTPPLKVQDPEKSSALSAEGSPVLDVEHLPLDNRPVIDLVQLAQMLDVARIDANGNLVPLQMQELSQAWQVLREKFPDQFVTPPDDTVTWQRRQAADSVSEGNLNAALFHLDRALGKVPQDAILLKQRAQVARALAKGDMASLTKQPVSHAIPARDPAATSQEIDLSAYYNLGLRDSLNQKPDGLSFADLPAGRHIFAKLNFDVRGIVCLQGQAVQKAGLTLPEGITNILVGRTCRVLHFLQATQWSSAIGSQIGQYILHYADGEVRELLIRYGQDVWDWWPEDPVVDQLNLALDAALPAWTGSVRVDDESHGTIFLYVSSRENPRPEVAISSIDFISSMATAAPFLAALTVE